MVNVAHCLLCLLYAAACMTWELAESGNDCITCVINGADLVPTFSAASVDDLRAEVLLRMFFMFWLHFRHYLGFCRSASTNSCLGLCLKNKH